MLEDGKEQRWVVDKQTTNNSWGLPNKHKHNLFIDWYTQNLHLQAVLLICIPYCLFNCFITSPQDTNHVLKILEGSVSITFCKTEDWQAPYPTPPMVGVVGPMYNTAPTLYSRSAYVQAYFENGLCQTHAQQLHLAIVSLPLKVGNLEVHMQPHEAHQGDYPFEKAPDFDHLVPIHEQLDLWDSPMPPHSSASRQQLFVVQSIHGCPGSHAPPYPSWTSQMETGSSPLSTASCDDSNLGPIPEVRCSVPLKTDEEGATYGCHLQHSYCGGFPGLERIFSIYERDCLRDWPIVTQILYYGQSWEISIVR